MVPPWNRIAYVVFGLAWIALGIKTLLDGGETGVGVCYLLLGVIWFAVAVLKGRGLRDRFRVDGGPQMTPSTERDPEA